MIHGAQILMSEDAALAIRRCGETIDLGCHLLRDLSKPMRILQVTHPKIRDVSPPIASVGVAAESVASA